MPRAMRKGTQDNAGIRRSGIERGPPQPMSAQSAVATATAALSKLSQNSGMVGGSDARRGRPQQSRRFRKVLKDNIYGVTAPDIRRLARRGGVKRISGDIYETARYAIKRRLQDVTNNDAHHINASIQTNTAYSFSVTLPLFLVSKHQAVVKFLHANLSMIDYTNRKLVTTLDAVYALKRQGNTIYVSSRNKRLGSFC